MKDVMIIRPGKEIGLGCCGGICSEPDSFVPMEEEFAHHDKDRDKLGEWYRRMVIGQESEWKVDYVDSRNLSAIVVCFAKHRKAGNITAFSALRSIIFRMKYNTLFINGEWKQGELLRREGMESKFSLKRLFELYDEVLSLPHKQEIARELRDEDDLFLLMVYSDMLGIPNPAFYYTLELYPYIIEKFHDWHLRMGMEKSPLDGIRCC